MLATINGKFSFIGSILGNYENVKNSESENSQTSENTTENFTDDTVYNANKVRYNSNKEYNKTTESERNDVEIGKQKQRDENEKGVLNDDARRNDEETAGELLRKVSRAGEHSDAGALRGVRQGSADGRRDNELFGHTQRQASESVLSEHDSGTAESFHGHSRRIVEQITSFIKKYATKQT